MKTPRSKSEQKKSRLAALTLGLLVAVPVAGCAVAEDSDVDEEAEPELTASSSDELSAYSCGTKATSGYSQGKSTGITTVTIDGKPVEQATANAYIVMAKAAEKDGVQLRIVSGFRTMAEQERLYACYKNCNCNGCALAARPGYSNHQSGHALDLNASARGVYDWLSKNAGRYGFKRTVPSENWHWEWWGGGPGGGPCSGGNAAVSGCRSDTLDKTVAENACVQSESNRAWYQCVNGNWLDRKTVPAACSSEHPLP